MRGGGGRAAPRRVARECAQQLLGALAGEAAPALALTVSAHRLQAAVLLERVLGFEVRVELVELVEERLERLGARWRRQRRLTLRRRRRRHSLKRRRRLGHRRRLERERCLGRLEVFRSDIFRSEVFRSEVVAPRQRLVHHHGELERLVIAPRRAVHAAQRRVDQQRRWSQQPILGPQGEPARAHERHATREGPRLIRATGEAHHVLPQQRRPVGLVPQEWEQLLPCKLFKARLVRLVVARRGPSPQPRAKVRVTPLGAAHDLIHGAGRAGAAGGVGGALGAALEEELEAARGRSRLEVE